VIVARLNNFAHSRRERAAPLNAGSRIADVDHNLVRIAFQNCTHDGFETIRISVLIEPVGGEQCQKGAQDQRLPSVRVRRALDGWKP
jgi:hypothetical protein